MLELGGHEREPAGLACWVGVPLIFVIIGGLTGGLALALAGIGHSLFEDEIIFKGEFVMGSLMMILVLPPLGIVAGLPSAVGAGLCGALLMQLKVRRGWVIATCGLAGVLLAGLQGRLGIWPLSVASPLMALAGGSAGVVCGHLAHKTFGFRSS